VFIVAAEVVVVEGVGSVGQLWDEGRFVVVVVFDTVFPGAFDREDRGEPCSFAFLAHSVAELFEHSSNRRGSRNSNEFSVDGLPFEGVGSYLHRSEVYVPYFIPVFRGVVHQFPGYTADDLVLLCGIKFSSVTYHDYSSILGGRLL